jgi:hypothetical protein
MDLVNVFHGSTNITEYVISYERNQKMCTGIHTLSLTLSPGLSFTPWDVLRIYEEGNLNGEFYVSSYGPKKPNNEYIVTAQCGSKRLVDYFIAESYTIEYPTYARSWIEQFLTEAGVTYEFTTESYGSLLSNNTTLGLMSAYDQIMYLLQISGWYMYFDERNTCKIGKMDVDYGRTRGTFTNRKLLSIKLVKHDKMLRNRAVVYGNVDPFTGQQIITDISTITPWNYDENDLRAVVVSNSNIPNQSSADTLASQILSEFADITQEKHITFHGGSKLHIGEVVRISNKIFNGKGVVTTQGASLSREGLVGMAILDERCPRLWAFFDYGDYVYVGTVSSGVYRKHILWDHTWSGFNEGLTESGISDLFVRGGVATCVTFSGLAWVTLAEEVKAAWSGIIIPPLMTFSGENSDRTLYPSGDMLVESGLMARGVIHDKVTNNIRLLVDNYSGGNYPGFFDMYSGVFINASGITAEMFSGLRAWVLDYTTSGNPGDDTSADYVSGYYGSPILVSSYPIEVSGNFGFIGIDIENDGRYDYVSVATSGEGVPTNPSGEYNFGYRGPVFGWGPDINIKTSISRTTDFSSGFTYTSRNGDDIYPASVFAYDDGDVAELAYVRRLPVGGTNEVCHLKITKEFDDFWNEFYPVKTFTSKSLTGIGFPIMGTHRVEEGIFKFFDGEKMYEWDVANNTITSETVNSTSFPYAPSVYIDGIAYTASANNTSNNLVVKLFSINTLTGEVGENEVLNYPADDYNRYRLSTIQTGRVNNNPAFLVHYTHEYRSSLLDEWDTALYGAYIQGLTAAGVELIHDFERPLDYGSPDPIFGIENYIQLNDSTFVGSTVAMFTDMTGDDPVYIWVRITQSNGSFNFEQFTSATLTLPPTNPLDGYTTIPLTGTDDGAFLMETATETIWKADSKWGNPVEEFLIEGYTVANIIQNADTVTEEIYVLVYDDNYDYYLIPYDTAGDEAGKKIVSTLSTGGDATLTMAGPWVIAYFPRYVQNEFSTVQADSSIRYLYNKGGISSGITFLVLQRDGGVFYVLQSGGYPYRLDVSAVSPLLTVQETLGTSRSMYVTGPGMFVDDFGGALTYGDTPVHDYRYTTLDSVASGIILNDVTVSGGSRSMVFVVESGLVLASGIFFTDLSLSMGVYDISYLISGVPVQMSGVPELIETTNYSFPDQFIFATSSGEEGLYRFYQKNPSGLMFQEHISGFPMDSRTTIIRVEDKI